MRKKTLLVDPPKRESFAIPYYSKSSIPIYDDSGNLISYQETVSSYKHNPVPVDSSVFSLSSLISTGNINNLSPVVVPPDLTPEQTLDIAQSFIETLSEKESFDNNHDNNNKSTKKEND